MWNKRKYYIFCASGTQSVKRNVTAYSSYILTPDKTNPEEITPIWISKIPKTMLVTYKVISCCFSTVVMKDYSLFNSNGNNFALLKSTPILSYSSHHKHKFIFIENCPCPRFIPPKVLQALKKSRSCVTI